MALVEVSTSSVHGKGVFILNDTHTDTRVCYYDGIKVSLDDEKTSQYALSSLDGTHKIIGFETPHKPDGCGQLINDAARLFIENPFDIEGAMRKVIEYELESRAGCNVSLRDNTTDIYTHRSIKKNQELFMHYGVPYWLADQANRAAETHNLNVIELRKFQKRENRNCAKGEVSEGLIKACIESKSHSHAFSKLCSLFRTAPPDRRSDIARAVLKGRLGES